MLFVSGFFHENEDMSCVKIFNSRVACVKVKKRTPIKFETHINVAFAIN